ncbi:uncharacterized protein LOC133919123 [Phragmites australis]|uniref:uncharacterized protein LOC133919123 n=1 Tax=Phragmites australis TaxID=29695 RepID=UPI002D783DC4|nr:uncharacterized protein LOC133919123 [Phragmites australis]XP_062219379.1 uncharacterized protein LOC133919123 [Phragmites australis]XP_062219380.1 uncharacterized protein LOC133919123 [Phragmites australis]
MARSPRARNLHTRRSRSASCDVSLASEKKEWKSATCPVCLEYPHDAVLLLCTSHHKGCRPYMCGTNYHHSNCLEHFKEAYAKEKLACSVSAESALGLSLSPNTRPASKQPCAMELACPLCRGEVKGWTVVEPARQYLNRKRRTCMHDSCSFIGSYKELCKHVNSKHPSAKPREIDPAIADEWKKFECEREREDAISTIRAMNPGAVIMGDYVLELNGGSNNRLHSDGDAFDLEERLNFFTSLDRTLNERIAFYESSDGSVDEDFDFLASLFARGRRISTGDSYSRAHRRHRERPRRNYSTGSVDASDIQHDSVTAQRGQRTGAVRAMGRTARQHHPMLAHIRSTRGS